MASSESKTLESSSTNCDLCEDATAESFCKNCQTSLCTKCVRYHGKLPATKHHEVVPLSERNTDSNVVPSDDAYCDVHTDVFLGVMCTDCLIAICGNCIPDHKHHKLMELKFDTNLAQQISSQKIPRLLEILQTLRKLKNETPTKIAIYNDARNLVNAWREEMIDDVNNEADFLISEIEKEIKKQETVENIATESVQEHVTKTDRNILKLTEARNITNMSRLLTQLNKSDTDLKEALAFIDRFKANNDTFSIDDVLPSQDKILQFKEYVQNVFKMNRFPLIDEVSLKGKTANVIQKRQNTKMRPKYGKLSKFSEKFIEKTSHCYRFSECDIPSVPIIYEAATSSLYEFNIENCSLDVYTCEHKIWGMVTLASGQHVIIDHNSNDIHLLNKSFKTVNTLKAKVHEDGFHSSGMCLKNDNIFILSQYSNEGKNSRFLEVEVYDNMFKTTTLCQAQVESYRGVMTLQEDDKIILQDTDRTYCVVDLKTGETDKVYFNYTTGDADISGMYHNGDSLLVGVHDGRIYTVRDGEETKVITEGRWNPGGITVVGDCLVVLSSWYAQVYK